MRNSFLALFLLLSALSAQAQEALVFTRIDRNPRSAAMAGAGAASVSNAAYSGFGKAALLPLQEGTLDAGLGFQLWAPGDALAKTTNIQLGAGARFGNFGVALSGAYQAGVPEGDFAPSDGIVGLGFAYRIGKFLSLGVNLRYAGQALAPGAKVHGFSGDFSVAGKLPAGFTVIGGVSTLGTRVKGSQEDMEFVQPAYVFLGGCWHKAFGKSALELDLDGEYDVAGKFAGAFGAEYAWDELLFFRAGYRLASAGAVIPSHLALGLGVQFAGFRIEAAWMGAASYAPKNNTLTFGLGYRF